MKSALYTMFMIAEVCMQFDKYSAANGMKIDTTPFELHFYQLIRTRNELVFIISFYARNNYTENNSTTEFRGFFIEYPTDCQLCPYFLS